MAKYSVKTGDTGRVKCIMHVLLAAAVVLQATTVIDVQANHTVTLRLQFGDIVYANDGL